ncbi:MAG: tetratricopeptide repeat protein, partial [Promethearchaeota archaeon]
TEIYHNLPLPDFDETGLIGRDQEVNEIKDLIFSHHNVITIIGEGGIGKTATLLKCLYDILDMEEKFFDAIIWVTLKTHVLTVQGIRTIDNSITTATGLFSKINEELSGKTTDVDYINEILNYLKEFSILIAIDNLETLNDNTIRNFITNISGKSKLVITSRIGIGEVEVRYPLYGLKEKSALQLMNIFAKIRHVENILTLSSDTKKNICKRLNYNPLAIKWFITSVQQGNSPQKLLKHAGDLHEFCFSNVYSKLSKESKLVLDTFMIHKKGFTEAEIAYLSNLDIVSYKKALNELFLTSMLKMETKPDSEGVLNNIFVLNDFAREYLNKFHKPSNERFVEITKRRKDLIAANQEIGSQIYRNPYDARSIIYKTSDEKIAASFLIRGLREASDRSLSNQEKLEKARPYIERAKELCPNYSEVYRVSAFIKANCGELFSANEDYETALELDPDSQTLNYYYAGFLMRFLDDYSTAEHYVNKVISKDSNSVEPQILKARLLSYQAKHKEANDTFEFILKRRAEYSKRRLAFVIDMYANNLKNWAEVEIQDHEYSSAGNHLLKALRRIDELKKEKLIDKKLIIRKNEIFSLLLRCLIYTKNEKIFKKIIIEYLDNIDIYKNDRNTIHAINQIKRYEKIIGIPKDFNEKYKNFKKYYSQFYEKDK